MGTIASSDKHYWHRFIPVYEAAFKKLGLVKRVVELGVLRGASIRWLATLYPEASIVGADILPIQEGWPQSSRISYRALDQGNRGAVRGFFDSLGTDVDLIIEDGSHVPQHQATCLAEGFRALRPGGLYVLEDIATSHPGHPSFARRTVRDGRQLPTALHVLLALQHLQDTAAAFSASIRASLTDQDFFSAADLEALWEAVGSIHLHKRTELPLACYACGGSDFDYLAWKCRCGASLYETADSMTCLIWRR